MFYIIYEFFHSEIKLHIDVDENELLNYIEYIEWFGYVKKQGKRFTQTTEIHMYTPI